MRSPAAMLLRYQVPTYYVFPEMLAAALRTELPDRCSLRLFFPFDALVIMLSKGTVFHPIEGGCRFLVSLTNFKPIRLTKPVFNIPSRKIQPLAKILRCVCR
jgi:hypothetical protein